MKVYAAIQVRIDWEFEKTIYEKVVSLHATEKGAKEKAKEAIINWVPNDNGTTDGIVVYENDNKYYALVPNGRRKDALKQLDFAKRFQKSNLYKMLDELQYNVTEEGVCAIEREMKEHPEWAMFSVRDTEIEETLFKFDLEKLGLHNWCGYYRCNNFDFDRDLGHFLNDDYWFRDYDKDEDYYCTVREMEIEP